MSFFTGDLNFRLRPLLAEDDDDAVATGDDLGDGGGEGKSGSASEDAVGEDEEDEDEPKDAKEHSSRKECKFAFEILGARKLAELVGFDQLLGEQRDGTLFQVS